MTGLNSAKSSKSPLIQVFKAIGKGCSNTSKNAEIGFEKHLDQSRRFWKALVQVRRPYTNCHCTAVWSTGKKNAEIGILTLFRRFLGLAGSFGIFPSPLLVSPNSYPKTRLWEKEGGSKLFRLSYMCLMRKRLGRKPLINAKVTTLVILILSRGFPR